MERVLRNEAVGNAVAKGDEGHDDERRQDVANVAPVYLGDLANHHTSNQDEGASRSPRRDRSKYRSKKYRDDETQSRDHSREAGTSTFGDTRTAFDEGRNRRAPKQSSD